jgi:hypothetical protein
MPDAPVVVIVEPDGRERVLRQRDGESEERFRERVAIVVALIEDLRGQRFPA